ncbi:MAG TPA: YCF48-related protein [Xanthomonadaceae bacterium]|nr:YCF48-related protein [Xanthomonadaceae bacterium]
MAMVAALALGLSACADPYAPKVTEEDIPDPGAAAQSVIMPLAASQSLVLDFTETDSRAVAVGERGHVLVSESRQDWRQVDAVPTSATLTSVDAVGAKVWAVGHDGVIVHSADGGLIWGLQRHDPHQSPGPDDDPFAIDPRQGAPLLDVMFFDADRGIAVGAYSLMLVTGDGGATWQVQDIGGFAGTQSDVVDGADEVDGVAVDGDAMAPDEVNWTFSDEELMLEAEENPHLNAIARTGSGALFIVGERGAAFRSRDGGRNWERLQMPYEGSMFDVLGFDGDHIVVLGLRGNVFESHDLGGTWTALPAPSEASLMAGAALPDGGFVAVGANGTVLRRATADVELELHRYQTRDLETPTLAAVMALGSGSFLVGGEKGIDRYQTGKGTAGAR